MWLARFFFLQKCHTGILYHSQHGSPITLQQIHYTKQEYYLHIIEKYRCKLTLMQQPT